MTRYFVRTRVEYLEFGDVITADSPEEAREKAISGIKFTLGDNYYEINDDPSVQEFG